jgi:C-terminal binding protein
VMMYHNIVISKDTISRLKHCKLIVRCGVGYDNVDHQFARERGIPVANVPDYGTEEVADSAIGMTLALTRGINFFNSRLQREPGRGAYMQGAPILRLRGRVFGIIGLGRIGTATAAAGEGAGNGRGVLRPVQAGRVRQGAGRPPRGEARRPAAAVVRRESSTAR